MRFSIYTFLFDNEYKNKISTITTDFIQRWQETLFQCAPGLKVLRFGRAAKKAVSTILQGVYL